jgi:hypothetical protein
MGPPTANASVSNSLPLSRPADNLHAKRMKRVFSAQRMMEKVRNCDCGGQPNEGLPRHQHNSRNAIFARRQIPNEIEARVDPA